MSPLPRWSLALLSGLVAAVAAWAATVLPWRDWTVFAWATGVLGATHAATAVLAALGHPLRGRAWRVQSIVALTYLAYITWNVLTASLYIAELYGGLGKGVAVSLGLAWMVVVAFTVPLSAWGLAVTGGLRLTKAGKAGAAVAALLFAAGLWEVRSAVAATPAVDRDELDNVAAAVEQMVEPVAIAPLAPDERPSLMTRDAAACANAPGPGWVTVVATYLVFDATERAVVKSKCFQGGTLDDATAAVKTAMGEEALRAPIKLDVITGVQPLVPLVPVVTGMTLRPGLDGVCEESRCLMPWQVIAMDLLRSVRPIPVVPELRFGFHPSILRRVLAPPDARGRIPTQVEGLTRIETASFVTDDAGAVHRLRRMRESDPPLDAASLNNALATAEQYILSAVSGDGRFEYVADPFTGQLSFRGFSLARQAGTTLVVCELARDRERARGVAVQALKMLASTQRIHGDIAALRYPPEKEVDTVALGDTALSSIAFLSCRDLVGPRFDEDIDRMTRFLLHMQRENGSFYPRINIKTGEPIPGPDPLYAVGQAVFALTLLEKLTASDDQLGFAKHAELRPAVEAAMNYIAEDYWNNFATSFFFMEENWHCLAARASLGHHRHEDYEQFCLDYVAYKTRLILDEQDGVGPDFIGGYGFGNVLLPHNTGSAGFGEAMSAAMAIREVRGEDLAPAARPMKLALGFLLHHQWDEVNCFACVRGGKHSMVGAFSETMGSPHVRIDYVQHAMAGMGHGGRMLGLVDGKSY